MLKDSRTYPAVTCVSSQEPNEALLFLPWPVKSFLTKMLQPWPVVLLLATLAVSLATPVQLGQGQEVSSDNNSKAIDTAFVEAYNKAIRVHPSYVRLATQLKIGKGQEDSSDNNSNTR